MLQSGPKYTDRNIQHVNKVVDIKEELYVSARLSHGVSIRSGNHKARSDTKDFEALIGVLEKTDAHKKVRGRKFGECKLSANLLESDMFDQASFYRWITTKNKEAAEIMKVKNGTTELIHDAR